MTKLYKSITSLSVDDKALSVAAQDLTKAKEDHASAVAALETERSNLRDMRVAITAGADVTSDDLRAAQARVEHAELRVTGTERALRAQTSRRLVTSTDLVACVYAALGEDVMPTVSLLVGLGSAPKEAPKGSGFPVLALVQPQAHDVAKDYRAMSCGGLTGTLELHYYRDDNLHKPLDDERVQRILTDAGITATLRPRIGQGKDVLTIDVSSAFPEVPKVAKPPTEEITDSRDAVRFLSGIVQTATSTPSGHYLFGDRPNPRDIGGARINAVGLINAPEIKSEVVKVSTSDGIRTATVVTTGEVFSQNGRLAELADAIHAKKGSPIGRVSNLGRITGSLLTVEPVALGAGQGLRVTNTLTIVSAV